MSNRPAKRLKLGTGRVYRNQTGRVYRDRIPIENDFEVVQARTASHSGPNNFAIETERTSIPSSWNFGTRWAPEDNLEFSLDPDGGWYDEALEADVADTAVETEASGGKKKKRSQISVWFIA